MSVSSFKSFYWRKSNYIVLIYYARYKCVIFHEWMKTLLALNFCSLLIANYVTMDAAHRKCFGNYICNVLLTRFLARGVNTSQIFALKTEFRKYEKKPLKLEVRWILLK